MKRLQQEVEIIECLSLTSAPSKISGTPTKPQHSQPRDAITAKRFNLCKAWEINGYFSVGHVVRGKSVLTT